jgi:hypothetical protein
MSYVETLEEMCPVRMTTKLKEDAKSAAKAQGISFSRLVRESLERNINELAKSHASSSISNGPVKS